MNRNNPCPPRFSVTTLTMLFIILSFSALSQTNLHIHMPGSRGKKALLWTYTDMISFRETISAKTVSDSHDDFEFTIYPSETTPVIIQVEFLKMRLYVSPGTNYQIEVSPVDFTNRDLYPKNIIAFFEPEFKITAPAPNVNTELEEVNEFIGSFLDSNYVRLYQSKVPPQAINRFFRDADSLRQELTFDFAKNHLDIQLVQLKLLTRKIGDNTVIRDWFSGDKIQYNNKIYMDFFNSYWSKYLLTGIRGLHYGQLDSVINLGKSYSDLSRLLAKKDAALRDPVLRELVIMRNFLEMYNLRRFSKEALTDILYDIAAHGANKKNKQIATAVLEAMMEYSDKKAPDFVLPGFDGKEYNRKSFEGKYVYLNFWTEQCRSCLAEMDYEKDLFLDFDDVIFFVSIYVGPDTATARKVFKTRGYQWTGLYFNNDFSLLKNYKAEVLPYYILLDKKGRLEWFPARRPQESFSDYFIQMLNDKKGNLK